MAQLGKRNGLKVLYSTPQGIYLDGGEEHGEILLPTRYIPSGTALDQILDVFVYRDSEDRVIATTEQPLACVGEFGTFEVVSVNSNVGAFLNWGLPKDLLLPFREQSEKVQAGEKVVAFVMVDPKTDRIVATTRINRHLSKERPRFRPKQEVSLIITNRTPLGYNAIVESTHVGLLYHSNIGAPLQPGQKLKGYVTGINQEGKIDLSLDASGYKRVASLTDQILQALKDAGGRLEMDDDSPPEVVREAFGASKKAFKQALGSLYRQRQIRFTRPGIEWIDIREPTSSDWQPGKA
jgi:predicted RNA-binding protein (virulence factor B family)